MCQSYRKTCICGQNTAEIFFGNMVLDEKSVDRVYCPKCSLGADPGKPSQVWDNGWVLELDMAVVRNQAPLMGLSPEEVTADLVFDEGYVTWVGMTPNDAQTRDEERSAILKLAKIDIRAYIQALKEWGLDRERRFLKEGWRKAKA